MNVPRYVTCATCIADTMDYLFKNSSSFPPLFCQHLLACETSRQAYVPELQLQKGLPKKQTPKSRTAIAIIIKTKGTQASIQLHGVHCRRHTGSGFTQSLKPAAAGGNIIASHCSSKSGAPPRWVGLCLFCAVEAVFVFP